MELTRTLRLKVRPEAYAWLNKAAREVNFVWNWSNATSYDASDRNRRAHARFLTGFDLCNLSAGASPYFNCIGADTIQRICTEYATKRKAAKKRRLRWRKSGGRRRSLGWIPFKSASLKRKGKGLRFAGKFFRVFDREYLGDYRFRDGCFAQDAVGDWYLCIPVRIPALQTAAPQEAVGIDLGLKVIATTSDGDPLPAGRWTQSIGPKLAMAQRRRHKRRVRALHRKAARCRQNALHQFTRRIINTYQTIYVGDVSSRKLAKTRMAKSVYDSGWGMLRTQLTYKGEHAGRSVVIVNEKNTTRTCHRCRARTGPAGLYRCDVRRWDCPACKTGHDRDVNAARNILAVGTRCGPPSAETSPKSTLPPPRRALRTRKAGTVAAQIAA
jgi:putative transposase